MAHRPDPNDRSLNPCLCTQNFEEPPFPCRLTTGPQGADSRFIVTNLPGLPRMLYEKLYCARGQAENLIKAHKLHLASDRTSCRKATANQFRLLIHTAAYWLLLSLRSLAPRNSFWRDAQFDTIRLCLIKVAARIKLALPSAFPYQAGFADLAGRIARLPPQTAGQDAPAQTLRRNLKPTSPRPKRHENSCLAFRHRLALSHPDE